MHCLYHLPCTCQSWVCTRGCQRRQNLLSRSVLGGEESSDGKSLKSLKLEMTDTWNSWRRVSYSSMVKSSGRSSTNSWPSNLGQGIKSDRLSSFIELNLFYIHDHCVITHTDSTEMSQWMNKVYPELCLQVAPSQYKTDPTYALCLGEFLWGMATVIITRGKRWRGDIGAMKDISSRLARFEMRSVEKGQDCSLLEQWRRATGGQPGPSTYSRLSNRLPPGTGPQRRVNQQPVSGDRSRQCCAASQSHFSSQHLVAKPCTTRRVY